MANDATKQIVQEVAAQAHGKEDKVVETKQMVTFVLDKEEYASNIGDLREIIKIRDIVPVPGSPSFIAGILNVRGQIVVVIDLEKRFSLNRSNKITPQHIIIVEVEGTVFGVIVDEVTGVLRIPVSSIKATPQMVASKIHSDYLQGVVVLEEGGSVGSATKEGAEKKNDEKEKAKATRLLLVLDMPLMLAEKELLQFGNAIKESVKETKAVE